MKILLLLVLFSTSLYAQDRHSPDFFTLASLGKVTGIAPERKFGVAPDVDTGDIPATVWSKGDVFVFPSSAALVSAVSTSSIDHSTNTGMRVVRVEGLNSSYEIISEDITLSGQTLVTSTAEFLFVNRAYGISSGTSEWNVGTIDIKHGSQVIAELPAEKGQTQQFVYIVPAGHTWLVDNITASQNKKGSGTITLEFQIMVHGTNTWRDIFPVGLDGAGTSQLQVLVGTSRFFAIPEKTKVRARVISASSSDNEVTASAAGYLINNSTFKF